MASRRRARRASARRRARMSSAATARSARAPSTNARAARRRRATRATASAKDARDAWTRARTAWRRATRGEKGDDDGRATMGGTTFEAREDATATWRELEAAAEGRRETTDAERADARAETRTFDAEGTPRLKLYRDSASWCPYSQKIWMQLEEKRIPYALERINMRCYGAKPRSFTAKVPSGALPVIELDGQTITESSVIARVIEQEFTEHKSLLPYAPGSAEGSRATKLMRLERTLFSRWMQWITSSWSDATAQSEYCQVLDEVDAELAANGGGAYFMGEEFTLVDIAFAPFLERMAASILYYKGVKIEGNGGRWPNVDRWFAAISQRKSYAGIKSDYYTTAHDLPPQLGGCAENGDNAEARDAIDGVDGVNWRLPLGPLDENSLEPWWGVDDPRAARVEAALRVIGNRENVVRFAARGCGEAGQPAYSAPLSDPNARPGEQHIPAVDEALRIVVHAMLDHDFDAAAPAPVAVSGASSFSAAPTIASLAYLRDRIGVPRDMSYPAARQFRAYLNWAIDSLAAL